ncbi:CoA transferase [Ramlibacter henchirensis]|nr:CoA transferase [Ramlibacter henchirensis]
MAAHNDRYSPRCFRTQLDAVEPGIYATALCGVKDIVDDPHYAARGTIATIEHPRLGPLRMQGVVPHMAGTPGPQIRPAPTLGEDTDDVLRELLGLTDRNTASMRADGVI